ncbi:MAG: SUMF1/EgtB/PvdO family nonheme iron enzyme [bacterium]
MLGNVWEWCADWLGAHGTTLQVDPAGPSRRLQPGLLGRLLVQLCRVRPAAYRLGNLPGYRNRYLGFRLPRSSCAQPAVAPAAGGAWPRQRSAGLGQRGAPVADCARGPTGTITHVFGFLRSVAIEAAFRRPRSGRASAYRFAGLLGSRSLRCPYAVRRRPRPPRRSRPRRELFPAKRACRPSGAAWRRR